MISLKEFIDANINESSCNAKKKESTTEDTEEEKKEEE